MSDVLIYVHYARKSANSSTVYINTVFASERGSATVQIKAVTDVCTLPGDNGEQVLTIMLPQEDLGLFKAALYFFINKVT